MSTSIRKVKTQYIYLDSRIILDPRLSLEGKAYYAMLEGECVAINDVPEEKIKELILVGYLEEVVE